MEICASLTNVDEWNSRGCTDYALKQGQGFYNNLFNNFYQEAGNGIWVPGISLLNEDIEGSLRFQGLIVDLCNSGFSGKYCRDPLFDVCSKYTRADLSHPIIRRVCGCYLPEEEYPEGNRACDTVCSGYDILRYYEKNSNAPQICHDSLCIIDNFTLLAKGSSIGDITFTQACPFCGTSECLCIVGDLNFVIQDSRMGALNLKTHCDEIKCYTTIEGVRTELPDCKQYINNFGLTTSVVDTKREVYRGYSISFFVFGIVLILLFLGLGLYLLFREIQPEIIRKPPLESSESPDSPDSLNPKKV